MSAENSISREGLIKTINLVKAAIAAQNFIPALTHICFDGVTACTYNDIAAIQVRSNLDFAGCLPGELLLKSLNSFSAERVLLQAGDHAILAAGRSKIKLPILPLADFPFQFPDGKCLVDLDLGDDVLEGIERCLISVGSDPNHPAQMGVTLEADDGNAVLFSTDNYTISKFMTKSPIDLPGDVPVILPTFFCNQLMALAKAFPTEPVTLEVRSGSLTAVFGAEAMLFTKMLVDLEPMDFNRIFRKYTATFSDGDAKGDIPDQFDAALNRSLLVLSSEMDKAVKVSCDKGKLQLFTTSQSGEVEDTMDFGPRDAGSKNFYIDPSLVLRASKSCGKMTLLDNCVALSNGTGKFVHLVSHSSS